jgi:aspartyl-tRNA(Asn)/glutamyl-tRNA(Gln) amidotransferase subunit A
LNSKSKHWSRDKKLNLLAQVLNHPKFNAKALRMGCLIRVSANTFWYYTSSQRTPQTPDYSPNHDKLGNIPFMTALEIAQAIKTRQQSAEETVTQALNDAQNSSDLNIFLSLSDIAIEQARAVDSKIARGETVGALAGVPVALKDNLCLRGTRTTAGSKMLERFVSPYTGTAVQHLLNAGAISIGKANLDEFGMGSSGENSAFGATKNPWDTSRVPGGSSSGSAASVAAGIVPIALGTDTGGSLRLPAAFTGTLGMKPTYGRVSRYGVVSYASSLDQVGVIAGSARDLAVTMQTICQHDPKDATSLHHQNTFTDALERDIAGLRVGIVREAVGAGNSGGVLGALEAVKTQLEGLGALLSDISLPSLETALATYYLIACPEASSNLARYDGMIYSHRGGFSGDINDVMMKARGEGFGAEVKRRILMGTYALSSGYYDAYYSRALKARALIAREFAKAFENLDVLLMPTAPSAAFKIGEKSDDPVSMYLTDVDTVAVNLAGLPAISIPFGFEDSSGAYHPDHGLPVGVQFIAPALTDERLITVTHALERVTKAKFMKLAENSKL